MSIEQVRVDGELLNDGAFAPSIAGFRSNDYPELAFLAINAYEGGGRHEVASLRMTRSNLSLLIEQLQELRDSLPCETCGRVD